MNLPRLAVVVALPALICGRAAACASPATWSPLGQITGASVCSLAVSSDYRQDETLWAGTPGYGLFVTHDAAAHWKRLGLPNPSSGSCPVVVSETGGIVVAVSDRAYASLDGGKTWTPWDLPIPPAVIAFSPGFETDRTVLAASDSGPIFRSADGGLTWTQVANWQNGLSKPGRIAYDFRFLAGGVAILSTGTGLFRSSDGGVTWSWANSGLPTVHDFDAQSSQPFDHTAAIVSIARVSSGTLYAGARLLNGSAIYSSADNGLHWTRMSRVGAVASVLHARGATLLLGTHDRGVLESEDAGRSWKSFSQHLSDRDVSALVEAPDGTLFLGASFDGVFSRLAAGRSWRPRSAGFPQTDPILSTLMLNSSDFLAGALTGMFRSTDGGVTWHPTNRGLPDDRTIDDLTRLHRAGRSEVLAATSDGLFRSRNRGVSWTPLGPTRARGVEAWSVSAAVVRGRVWIAGGTENGLFFSDDDGAHWRILVRGDMNVTEVQFDPRGSGVLYALCAGSLEVYTLRAHRTLVPAVNNQAITRFTAMPSGHTILLSTAGALYRLDGRSQPRRVLAWQEGAQPVFSHPAGHNPVLLGSGSRLYVGRNNGDSWTVTRTPGRSAILALASGSGGALVSLADRGVWRFHV